MATAKLNEKAANEKVKQMLSAAETLRRGLLDRVAASAAADVERVKVERERLQRNDPTGKRVQLRERQAAGAQKLAEFAKMAGRLRKEGDTVKRGEDFVLSGRVTDAAGAGAKNVRARFIDASGRELATEPLTVDERGEFFLRVPLSKLEGEGITVSIVNARGEVLKDEVTTVKPKGVPIQTVNVQLPRRGRTPR